MPCVKLLLSAGAERDARDGYGRTALDAARQHHPRDITLINLLSFRGMIANERTRPVKP